MKNDICWNLIMTKPNAAVQVKKGNNVVMEGLGSTMPRGNAKSLYEHFFHDLQLVLRIRNTSEIVNQQVHKIVANPS
jgi:hypothetical protein